MFVSGLGAALEQAQLSCIPAGEGLPLCVAGKVLTTKLTGKQSGGDCVVSELLVRPQGGPPLHRHMQHETLYVLSGELEVTGVRGGKFVTYTGQAGSLIHIPGCVPHTFFNATENPARVLSYHGPAGLEGFYTEIGEPLKGDGTCGDLASARERFIDAALRHGIEPIDPELFDQREGYRATGIHMYDVQRARPMAMPSLMVRFLARYEQSDSQLTVLELTQLSGGSTAMVSHQQAAVFYALDGAGSFTTSRRGSVEQFDVEAGCTVLIPRNTQYNYTSGSLPLRMLCFYSPAGIEDFIVAASQPVASAAEFLAGTGAAPTVDELQRLSDMGVLHGVTVYGAALDPRHH